MHIRYVTDDGTQFRSMKEASEYEMEQRARASLRALVKGPGYSDRFGPEELVHWIAHRRDELLFLLSEWRTAHDKLLQDDDDDLPAGDMGTLPRPGAPLPTAAFDFKHPYGPGINPIRTKARSSTAVREVK